MMKIVKKHPVLCISRSKSEVKIDTHMSVLTDVQWIHCNICFIIINLETTMIAASVINVAQCHLAHCSCPLLLLLVPLAPGPPAVDVLHRLIEHTAEQLGHLVPWDIANGDKNIFTWMSIPSRTLALVVAMPE